MIITEILSLSRKVPATSMMRFSLMLMSAVWITYFAVLRLVMFLCCRGLRAFTLMRLSCLSTLLTCVILLPKWSVSLTFFP